MPAGRPLIFEDPKALQDAIDIYFSECKEEKLIPTIAGLAYSLGVDRHTIYNYEEKDEYFHTIKKARDFILSRIESSMVNSNGNVTGKIFVAKNYGYTDKQEIEHSGDVNIKVNGLDKV